MDEKKFDFKGLFKKWWFWVIVFLIIGGISYFAGGGNVEQSTNQQGETNTTQVTGTLPTLNKWDFIGQEGLVAFKNIQDKGYTVIARYENPDAPDTNQEMTGQFSAAKIDSCSDRLGWDAYIVDGLEQNGDNITIIVKSKSNNNQTCPADTINDLE
jgi:hypothetical protein